MDIKKDIIRKILKQKGFSEDQIENSQISLTEETNSNLFQVSVPISAKKFIKDVLIDELGAVVKISPWLSFISISSGIEFLGKCIDTNNPTDWNISGVSRSNFDHAVNSLDSLTKYRPLLPKNQFDLYGEFRCGLVHSCAPKDKISLSHGLHEQRNLVNTNGVINFNADELYQDFKSACEEVINMIFQELNKMNNAKLHINLTVNIEKPK